MASGPGVALGIRKRRAILFVLIGLLLYLCLYAAWEALVYHYGQRNRFFMIGTAPLRQYDYVIVGASHAMPFDFEDMNRRLQEASGTHIINLSIEGGGVLPARLMVDYFLAAHTTRNVLYFLDSFAFQSAQWNEARLADASAVARAVRSRPGCDAMAISLGTAESARLSQRLLQDQQPRPVRAGCDRS